MISLFSRLRSNQFTTVQSYPLISIHSNIRIISLSLAARKNSKIAITRSCHLVSALSANLRLLHLYQSIPVRWTFSYMVYAITDIKNCMCNYWYRIYTAMDFPCFISILSKLYSIQSYCCLITASYYINCASFIRRSSWKETIPQSIITTHQAYSIPIHYDLRLIIS